MIELKDINFSYNKDKAILSDFSLKIEKAEFCSILGLNGIGKSTLIKIMSGYLKPSSGSVKIATKDIASFSTKELAKIRSVLEQESQLSFNYTVKEVVELGYFALDEKSLSEIMQECEITELSHRNYTELSGGEKQRVSLARAIAQIYSEDMSQKILFLDEPSASLDPLHTHLIMRLAKKLQARNCTIVAILHDPNLAYAYSSKIVGIGNSKLAFALPPQEFMQSHIIRKLYNCPCSILEQDQRKFVIFDTELRVD